MISRTKRRRIFYLLVLVFVILGAGTVLYSQGWRLDWSNLSPQKVGAIYIRSYPDGAGIKLDGKPVPNGSWLLQSGTLINGLFPNKTYHIELTADGYRDWKQSVVVHPSLVAELAPAVLVPEKPLAVSSSPAVAFWAHGSSLVVQQQGDGLVVNGQPLPGTTLVSQTADFKTLLTQDIKANVYYVVQTDTGEGVSATTLLRRAGIDQSRLTRLTLDEQDGGKLMLYQASRLSYLTIASDQIKVLEASSSPETAVASSRLYWAWTVRRGGVSALRIYNKFLDQRLTGVPAFGTHIIKLAWMNDDHLAILQDDGRLYTYAVGPQELTQIASDVRDFQFDPSGTLVAAVENQALEVISLSEKQDYWRFTMPNAGDIQNVLWYRDGRHLFLQYPGYVSFLDVKDKLLEHVERFANIEQPQYDSDTNQFYYLQGGAIFSYDLPKS